ncbi:hypothetical protein HDV05_007333 [Chytridiales sp. JEL 0842]|nr:hypothetical protein HDV05_007333 [Chytridiales sp. JEL 0842]
MQQQPRRRQVVAQPAPAPPTTSISMQSPGDQSFTGPATTTVNTNTNNSNSNATSTSRPPSSSSPSPTTVQPIFIPSNPMPPLDSTVSSCTAYADLCIRTVNTSCVNAAWSMSCDEADITRRVLPPGWPADKRDVCGFCICDASNAIALFQCARPLGGSKIVVDQGVINSDGGTGGNPGSTAANENVAINAKDPATLNGDVDPTRSRSTTTIVASTIGSLALVSFLAVGLFVVRRRRSSHRKSEIYHPNSRKYSKDNLLDNKFSSSRKNSLVSDGYPSLSKSTLGRTKDAVRDLERVMELPPLASISGHHPIGESAVKLPEPVASVYNDQQQMTGSYLLGGGTELSSSLYDFMNPAPLLGAEQMTTQATAENPFSDPTPSTATLATTTYTPMNPTQDATATSSSSQQDATSTTWDSYTYALQYHAWQLQQRQWQIQQREFYLAKEKARKEAIERGEKPAVEEVKMIKKKKDSGGSRESTVSSSSSSYRSSMVFMESNHGDDDDDDDNEGEETRGSLVRVEEYNGAQGLEVLALSSVLESTGETVTSQIVVLPCMVSQEEQQQQEEEREEGYMVHLGQVPREEGELELQVGDRVVVLKVLDGGWWGEGYVVGTLEVGSEGDEMFTTKRIKPNGKNAFRRASRIYVLVWEMSMGSAHSTPSSTRRGSKDPPVPKGKEAEGRRRTGGPFGKKAGGWRGSKARVGVETIKEAEEPKGGGQAGVYSVATSAVVLPASRDSAALNDTMVMLPSPLPSPLGETSPAKTAEKPPTKVPTHQRISPPDSEQGGAFNKPVPTTAITTTNIPTHPDLLPRQRAMAVTEGRADSFCQQEEEDPIVLSSETTDSNTHLENNNLLASIPRTTSAEVQDFNNSETELPSPLFANDTFPRKLPKGPLKKVATAAGGGGLVATIPNQPDSISGDSLTNQSQLMVAARTESVVSGVSSVDSQPAPPEPRLSFTTNNTTKNNAGEVESGQQHFRSSTVSSQDSEAQLIQSQSLLAPKQVPSASASSAASSTSEMLRTTQTESTLIMVSVNSFSKETEQQQQQQVQSGQAQQQRYEPPRHWERRASLSTPLEAIVAEEKGPSPLPSRRPTMTDEFGNLINKTHPNNNGAAEGASNVGPAEGAGARRASLPDAVPPALSHLQTRNSIKRNPPPPNPFHPLPSRQPSLRLAQHQQQPTHQVLTEAAQTLSAFGIPLTDPSTLQSLSTSIASVSHNTNNTSMASTLTSNHSSANMFAQTTSGGEGVEGDPFTIRSLLGIDSVGCTKEDDGSADPIWIFDRQHSNSGGGIGAGGVPTVGGAAGRTASVGSRRMSLPNNFRTGSLKRKDTFPSTFQQSSRIHEKHSSTNSSSSSMSTSCFKRNMEEVKNSLLSTPITSSSPAPVDSKPLPPQTIHEESPPPSLPRPPSVPQPPTRTPHPPISGAPRRPSIRGILKNSNNGHSDSRSSILQQQQQESLMSPLGPSSGFIASGISEAGEHQGRSSEVARRHVKIVER